MGSSRQEYWSGLPLPSLGVGTGLLKTWSGNSQECPRLSGNLWEQNYFGNNQFSSVQSLSHVRLFATPWIAARQASLSITNSRSSLRLMSIESVMPSSHLILCYPLLLLPPIPPSITVFSNESTLRMRWPKYWSFSFSIIPSKEIPGLILRQYSLFFILILFHCTSGRGLLDVWYFDRLNAKADRRISLSLIKLDIKAKM